MLTEITLKNFKCFKEKTHFPLSKINLLTGVNGGGKSSMLQSVLLFKQPPYSYVAHLNNDYIELGTLGDLKNSLTMAKMPIEITFKDKNEELNHFYFATHDFSKIIEGKQTLYKVNPNDRYLHILKREWRKGEDLDVMDKIYMLLAELPFIHYISADRIGPQNFYLYLNDYENFKRDKQGKYTPFILFIKKDDFVEDRLCLKDKAQTVLQQTEAWLNEIFDGAKVELKADHDKISMSYNTKNTPNRYKPSNLGFGYSYILPIIISGLIAQRGEILIVENPEAHLHPRAQSKLTKFLAKVASCGVQVFIETHSEHILNALRVVSVSEDYEIKNTDISVLYFQNDDNQLVIPIPIQENGGIEVWPDGFFDQTDKDFKILFGF
jgi:predicted ATPase